MFCVTPAIDNDVNMRGAHGGEKDRSVLDGVSRLARNLIGSRIAIYADSRRKGELDGVAVGPFPLDSQICPRLAFTRRLSIDRYFHLPGRPGRYPYPQVGRRGDRCLY